MGRKKCGIGVQKMSPFERELLKALHGIKDEIRKLNSKIMPPPEPMVYSAEPEQEYEPNKQVTIDSLNAMIDK